MHFVKLGSPKSATDAFAMRGTRAVIAAKVISKEKLYKNVKLYLLIELNELGNPIFVGILLV